MSSVSWGLGPGARWWHGPSWRMWLTRSAGARAGILKEPGVLPTVGWKRLAPVPHTQGSETRAPAACPLACIELEKLGSGKWVLNLQQGSWRDITITHNTATLFVRLIVGVKKEHFLITRDEEIKGQHVWKRLMYYFSEACLSLLLKWNNLVRHLLFLHGGIYCWPMSAHCNPCLEHGCITSVTYSWSS